MDIQDRDSGVLAPDDGAEFHEHDGSMPLNFAIDDYASFDLHPMDHAISGAELRRRLITPEALAAMEADTPRPSLLERLLRRLRLSR